MPSFVTLPASKVLGLAKAKIDQIDASNKRDLARAISDYRKGWWIFRPPANLTDSEIERILILGNKFFYHGGHAKSIASDLVNALKYADPNSTVQVDAHDFSFLT